MLTAKIINNELSWQGEVKKGDIYPGYCCPGFDWEVILVFPDANPGYVSIWGACNNPNCPDFDGSEDDYYRGVSSIDQEDFVENLAMGKARHAAAWDDPAKTADFFTGPPSTGLEPYTAFGDWATAHGYDLDDEAQMDTAIAKYGEE